jgi:hypothetical protein
MRKRRTVLAAWMAAGWCVTAGAAERTVSIRDYVGWGVSPDLVNYEVKGSKAELGRVGGMGPGGLPLAVQATPAAEESAAATLSFVA